MVSFIQRYIRLLKDHVIRHSPRQLLETVIHSKAFCIFFMALWGLILLVVYLITLQVFRCYYLGDDQRLPAAGINEDPVTGSAHCLLTPYWSKKLSKRDLKAYQASARGGELILHLEGDRVIFRGQAVNIFQGQFVEQ